MTSRACSTEYRLKHPCGKAAGVLCRICTVLVLLCRGGRLCPPCMTAPYHFVGDGVLDVPHRRGRCPHRPARVIPSQCAPRSKCPWGTHWRGNPFPLCGGVRAPRPTAQRPIANTGGKNCQIRHFAQISRRMLADVPKFRKLREITCKRHAAVVHLHYTS